MEALASTLRQTCSDPICPEFIGVQNRGMKRWLSLEIAKYFNIFANVTFMFPRDMIRHFFVSTGVLEPNQPELSKDILELMILDVLPDLLHNEAFHPISHYIGEDHDGIRLFHVASHMARLFDDYLVYRPETILEWQESFSIG